MTKREEFHLQNRPLIFLHGALADQHQFDSLKARLQHVFTIHSLDFEGHGNAKDGGRPFRIEHFAENVINYMNNRNISVANLFGYSMGGYVALYLAKKEPERIHRISTLGTIVEWNEDKAMTETVYLHPEKMEDKVPHFAEVLRKRHKGDWVTLVNKTREMLEYLGRRPAIRKEEWRKLTQPVRMHVGDRDNTAGIEPAIEVYNRLDNGELVVLPHTPHPIEKVNEQWLVYSLSDFFDEEAVNSRAF